MADLYDTLADRIVRGAQQSYVADLTGRLMNMLADGVTNPDRYSAITRISRDAAMGCWAQHAPTVLGQVRVAFTEALMQEDTSIIKSLTHKRATNAPAGFGLTNIAKNIVQQSAEDLANIMRRQNVTLATTMADCFNEVVGDAITRFNLGESMENVMRRAVVTLAGHGLETIDYKSGVHTSIDACIRRHVVTEQNQCKNSLLMRRCDEWGQDLVMVSSHYACRPTHEWFQGQVFSRSGRSGTTSASNKAKVSFQPLSLTGYMTDPGGLCGCNCKHSLIPFVAGYSQLPDTEFKEQRREHNGQTIEEHYQAVQKQRYYERQIRQVKREIAYGEAQGVDVTVQRYKLGDIQKKQREHCKENNLKRQAQREKAYAVPDPKGSMQAVKITKQPMALTRKNSNLSNQNTQPKTTNYLNVGFVKRLNLSVSTEILAMPNGGASVTIPDRKCDIYKTKDGLRFIFPQNMSQSKQDMTPQRAIELFDKVPANIKKYANKDIFFVDYANPMDAYWRKIYKGFTRSYATGGDSIVFYESTNHNDDYVVRTYCHEIGHQVDRHMGDFSYGSKWIDAMAADKKVSNKESPTAYGENSNKEDFAESTEEWALNNADFVVRFPNRAALLNSIY